MSLRHKQQNQVVFSFESLMNDDLIIVYWIGFVGI
jgi:hypothetical protein